MSIKSKAKHITAQSRDLALDSAKNVDFGAESTTNLQGKGAESRDFVE